MPKFGVFFVPEGALLEINFFTIHGYFIRKNTMPNALFTLTFSSSGFFIILKSEQLDNDNLSPKSLLADSSHGSNGPSSLNLKVAFYLSEIPCQARDDRKG